MTEFWKLFSKMFVCIVEDMAQPVGYIPIGMAAGMIVLLIWRLVFGECTDKWKIFFCVVYTVVLLNLTIFSREFGSRDGIDLKLFGTWGRTVRSHSYFVENILLFIPFGVLFPWKIPLLQTGWCCVMAGFLCSVCLELIQLLTKRGFCQLDDVVTNTLGTGIGWFFFHIWHRMKHKN